MLLQLFRDYAARLDLPPPLYSERPVRYWIDLDADGGLQGMMVDTADADNPAQRHGVRRAVPTVARSSAIRPRLLADTAEWTLGYVQKTTGRAAQRHAAYVELLAACHEATGEPAVGAVLRFLESRPLDRLTPGDGFDASALIGFRVDGQAVVDLPSVRAFWAGHHGPGDGTADTLQCLVCAGERPAVRRQKEKIKGIPGGKFAGTALISANEEAFSSYGLKESLIAPVCGDCGERFTKGLNALLASEDAVRIRDMAFVAWTRGEREFRPFAPLTNPDDFGDELDAWAGLPPDATPGDFAAQLDVRSGRAPPPLDEDRQDQLYAVGLSVTNGRAAVRSWHTTTVGEAARNAARWYDRQKIVGECDGKPWTDARRLGLYELARATVRERGLPAGRKRVRGRSSALAGATMRELRNLPSTAARALIEGFLTGGPLPLGLLIRAVRRTQADREVRRSHAALIKMVLRSRHGESDGEDTLVSLDKEAASVAYHCGRLFAELENTQRRALPNVSATIVDRYFGKASTAPGSVFGPLVEGAQPHLSKLERDWPEAYHAIQRRLEEIMDRIAGEFPGVLAPEKQGEFVLGYYHQRASNRAEAAARSGGDGASGEEDVANES